MKAILVGTLEGGLSIKKIVNDAEARRTADALVVYGSNQIVSAIDINDPGSKEAGARRHDGGDHFVMIGYGLGNGFSLYGPFESNFDATEFGDRCDSQYGNDWEVMVSAEPAPSLIKSDLDLKHEQDRANLTAMMLAFFSAEIGNENHGGVSPATLQSAYESLRQMPEDVLFDLNEEAISLKNACTYSEVKEELEEMIAAIGAEAELSSLFEKFQLPSL